MQLFLERLLRRHQKWRGDPYRRWYFVGPHRARQLSLMIPSGVFAVIQI